MYLQSKTQGRLRCQKRRSLPQPVKKPQNHFHEYRQKVTVTTLFQTAFHRIFQLLAQTPHVCFHGRKLVHHSALLKGSHTRAYTAKHGRFGRGWYHYPRTVPHVSETLRGQGVERQTLPILSLGRVCARRTQKAFGTAMRLCASLSRGVAAPLGCVIFFAFVEIAACTPCTHGLSACARRGVVSLPSVHFACSRNAGRPLVKKANLPFSEVGWA